MKPKDKQKKPYRKPVLKKYTQVLKVTLGT